MPACCCGDQGKCQVARIYPWWRLKDNSSSACCIMMSTNERADVFFGIYECRAHISMSICRYLSFVLLTTKDFFPISTQMGEVQFLLIYEVVFATCKWGRHSVSNSNANKGYILLYISSWGDLLPCHRSLRDQWCNTSNNATQPTWQTLLTLFFYALFHASHAVTRWTLHGWKISSWLSKTVNSEVSTCLDYRRDCTELSLWSKEETKGR